MINHKYKFIFIHVPKTAGTSIIQSIIESNTEYHLKQHSNYVKCINQDQYKDYFKFSVARNPWGRLVSLYFEKKPMYVCNLNFKEYLYALYKDNQKQKQILNVDPNAVMHASPLMDCWYKDIYEQINFIGNFERLDLVVKKISEVLRKKIQINHAKKTFYNKHYSEYYDDDTKNIVLEVHKKDIKQFGYTFEP